MIGTRASDCRSVVHFCQQQRPAKARNQNLLLQAAVLARVWLMEHLLL
jgi:hypothetical protein